MPVPTTTPELARDTGSVETNTREQEMKFGISHKGCNVLYKGRVIETCASEDAAIVRRDEIINLYM